MLIIKQENRSVAVSTPLAEDELVLRRMSGHEGMSQLFEYKLEMFSDDLEIKHEDLLGGNATVRVALAEDETRYFNGYISSFSLVEQEGHHCTYQAILRPWLWFLTKTSDCRIFQEKTVPDIIQEVFRDHGFTDFKDEMSGTYRTWEYCVQYRETDFNFVSRLMEQEGIYYYFTHENGKHDLVLADALSSHQVTEGYSDVPYFPPENTSQRKQDHINSWLIKKEVQSGSCVLNDFNFKTPKGGMINVSTDEKSHDSAAFQIYDYPGDFTETADGEKYARKRIEELHAQYEIASGAGDVRGLTAGALFKLSDYPRDDQNREYLILSADYEISSDALEGGKEDNEETFHCSFSAIDSKIQYRAPRITPKPIVQGLQTAIVVGPSGEEIHTDEYGRIKVHFHWDRYGKADDTDSCWIRVAQMWAGKGWGSMYIPRVGQEVIVDFLEGDPDKPIITGRVYNADCMPPHELPANKTMSTTKSSSSKGGQGFNEIRFEDKKGEEQIFIHGEKNQDTRIKNDCFENIGNDRHLTVANDQFELVENNRNEEVKMDHMEKIGKDRHLKVVGKEAKGVDGTLSLTVKGDVAEVFKANHSELTTDDYYLKATNICIEATTNITLKVGGSSIAIESSGIQIKTSGDIKIDASKNVTAEAGMDFAGKGGMNMDLEAGVGLTAKGGATAEVSGSTMLTLKGGLVKIN